jgi:hypothetical protein
MSGNFSYFVVFAEMRTGSNFLEQNINQYPDLQSHGELFNPHFIGGANKDELFGVTLKARQKDPFQLLAAIAEDGKIPGFRFFNDHDPRILERCLSDPACGKVILTRNVLDAYVSRKIAAATGQWKLTNLKHQKTASIEFDTAEFTSHLENTQAFQVKLLNALQASGQTAYYINYDDLHSLDTLNGLARFLGSSHQVEAVNRDLKRQNPASLETKVSNFTEMKAELARIDFMGLTRTPNFEPRRGAGVPRFALGEKAPIIVMPIQGGPVENLRDWLNGHGGLIEGLNQKELRQWRKDNAGFKAIAVLRHPVIRAYLGFCDVILSTERGAYREIRETLIRQFKVGVPKKNSDDSGYDLAAHKKAFVAFLKFLKANLGNQTSFKIDPVWASQSAVLDGAAHVLIPSHIIHEADLAIGLAHLESLLGLAPVAIEPAAQTRIFNLGDVYDADIESRIRDVYARDYLNFGFDDWIPQTLN